MNPAVFLDRDGTIMEDAGYVGAPEGVRVLDGAAQAVRRMAELGYLVVVVSNQSGVARGLFDEKAVARVHDRLETLLADAGARLDGAYYCPYLDGREAKVEAYRRDSELRKPRPGMLLEAAKELDIDLSRSWMIGDSECDIEAGSRAGCRTIWLNPDASRRLSASVQATHGATDLLAAARLVERTMKTDSDTPHKKRASRQSTPADAPPDPDEVVALLTRIHDQIERARRDVGQHDFSLLRLFGALLQMFAIVAVAWGAVLMFQDQSADATARFALAGFLQLASLSAFAVDRFR